MRKPSAIGLVVLAALGVALTIPASPAAAAPPTVTVTPSTNLVDQQVVTVQATGVSGFYGLCEGVALPGVPTLDGCGEGTTDVPAQGNTSFSVDYAVRRAIYVPGLGRVVDCADPNELCQIAVADAESIPDTLSLTPLSFAPAPLPAATMSVTAGTTGTQKQVSGSNFFTSTRVDVLQCPGGSVDTSSCEQTPGSFSPTTNTYSTGSFDATLFVLPSIGSTDCTSAPGACELRALQGPLSVVAPLTIDRAAFPARPDGRIVRLLNGSVIGNNVYGSTGAGEQRIRPLAPGARLFFPVQIENDSQLSDDIFMTGPGSATGFTVRYFFGYYNVTAAVTGAGLQLYAMEPGAVYTLSVDIQADAGVAPGSSKDLLITFTSGSDSTKIDAVKVGVTVPAPT